MESQQQQEYADGSRYVGDWHAGARGGRGEWTASDGCHVDGVSYVGEWLRGERHGKGTAVEADGETYDGQFVGGVRSGRGKVRGATWMPASAPGSRIATSAASAHALTHATTVNGAGSSLSAVH